MAPAFDASYYDDERLWPESDTSAEADADRIRATAALVPSGVETVADVGAGSGAFLTHLRRERPLARAVALERSPIALAHYDGLGVCASAASLPIADRGVDLVAACEVIEHLPHGVFDDALAELERVSARYVLVTVPNDEQLSVGFLTCPECRCSFHRNRHLRSFSSESMRTLMPTFAVRTIVPIGPVVAFHPAALVLAARAVRRRPPAAAGSPQCPQCGFRTFARARRVDAAEQGDRTAKPRRPALRRLLPTQRKQLWLAGLFERPT